MVIEKELVSTLCLQVLIVLELFFDEDDHLYCKDLENIIMFLNKHSIKHPILRQNSVERVIPLYNDEQFKSHFRYVLNIFLYKYLQVSSYFQQ